jgi:hypothetical protein
MVETAEIQASISSTLFQLQVLNQRLQALTQNRQGVELAIGKEAIGGLGGILAEEIFGSARAGSIGYSLTKKLVSSGQARQSTAEKMRIGYELDQILERSLGLLSQISVDHILTPRGNSHQLVLRLRRIASYVTLETKLLRAIQFFQSLHQQKLLLNKDVPDALATRRPGYVEAYELLRQLEESLRKLIQGSLSSLSSDWWVDRIPSDVRTNAEAKKNKNDRQWPWANGQDLHPIYYVDFPDYVKIIRKKDNWHQAFEKSFRTVISFL